MKLNVHRKNLYVIHDRTVICQVTKNGRAHFEELYTLFYFYFEKVAFGKKVVYNVGADSGKK